MKEWRLLSYDESAEHGNLVLSMPAFRYITVLIWIAWPLSAPYANYLVQPAGQMRDTAFLHIVHDNSGTILRCTELKTDAF